LGKEEFLLHEHGDVDRRWKLKHNVKRIGKDGRFSKEHRTSIGEKAVWGNRQGATDGTEHHLPGEKPGVKRKTG